MDRPVGLSISNEAVAGQTCSYKRSWIISKHLRFTLKTDGSRQRGSAI
jgi:hypothetical protein